MAVQMVASSVVKVLALLELRLVRAIRIVNGMDRTVEMADSTVMVRTVVDLIATDKTVETVDSTVMVRTVVDLTVVARVADLVEVREETLDHHQLITLQQIKQQLKRSLLERNRLIAAKIKKKLSMKTSSLKQRRRLKLQQVLFLQRLISWNQFLFQTLLVR